MDNDTRKRRYREQMRRKRRIQRNFRIGLIVSVVIIIVVTIAFINRKPKTEEAANTQVDAQEQELQKERVETAKTFLVELYESTFTGEADDPAEATQGEATKAEAKAFAEWLFSYVDESTKEKLLSFAEDGILTEAEVYEAVGESLLVLADRRKGLLEDEQTAAANNIYIRDGEGKKEATITIAGDLCLAEDGFVLDHYDTVNDLTQCISQEILDITNQSDIFYVNHEYCISDRGEALSGKYYTFRAKPERMAILEQMGTDIVSLANNHVYDFGANALLDTADLLDDANIPYVGGGRNIEEAKRPIYFIVDGIKIGFVAASNGEKIKYTPQATEDTPGILRAYDTTEYNQVIRKAAEECDYLIAYIHWGTEDSNYYNSSQETWGREFLNSGADIVIGGHPHVLQGIEYVEGKPIIYSLGDFWFNHETKYTGVLKLNISLEGLAEMSFVPCLQTGYTTRYLDTAEEQEELYAFLENLSPNIAIDENGVITEK